MYETDIRPQDKTLDKTANMIPPLALEFLQNLQNMNIDLDSIVETKISVIPPLTFSQLDVLFSLHTDKKRFQTDFAGGFF